MPFFILLNIAVGGNWPGSPSTSTIFPAEMQVDYIRVYKDNSELGLAENQESLGKEFEQILNDNFYNLLVSES